MPDQNDRQLPAAVHDQLKQALQGGQGFRVQVVRVIDEQRDRLLDLAE